MVLKHLLRVRNNRTLFHCPFYGTVDIVLWVHKEEEGGTMAILTILAIIVIFPLMVIGEITKKYK